MPSITGHGRLGADVAETEDGASVGDDRDGVLLDRQRPHLAGSSAIARDTRATPGVYAIERSSRVLIGSFGHDLELAAEMHEERAIRDVLDEDAVEVAHRLDDAADVLCVAREDRHVAHFRPVLDANEVDRVEQRVVVRDRGCERRERAGTIRQVHAQRRAELRRGMSDRRHAASLGAPPRRGIRAPAHEMLRHSRRAVRPTADGAEPVRLDTEPMPVDVYAELAAPLSPREALLEADACLECGGPYAPAPCTAACPAGVDVPGFVGAIARGDPKGAAELIFAENLCKRGRLPQEEPLTFVVFAGDGGTRRGSGRRSASRTC